MSALTFTLKIKLERTLNMSPLVPNNLVGQTLAMIKKLPLAYGKDTILAGDAFTIKGKDNRQVRIEKSCDKLIHIGQGLAIGTIEVHGDVGDFLGQSMTAGMICVVGHAGAWLGNNLSGGRINISGNAGDYVGAGLPGEPFGMRHGIINIMGHAGDRAGDRMRRGTIIIHKKTGHYLGSRIHAGTIIALGQVGHYPGEGMRRGTIIMAQKPARFLPTFKSCGHLEMPFLRLLFTQLAQTSSDLALLKRYKPFVHRYSGDLARGGKGEILVL